AVTGPGEWCASHVHAVQRQHTARDGAGERHPEPLIQHQLQPVHRQLAPDAVWSAELLPDRDRASDDFGFRANRLGGEQSRVGCADVLWPDVAHGTILRVRISGMEYLHAKSWTRIPVGSRSR